MILINLLHPNILFDNSTWVIKSYNNFIEDNVTYTINDVLTVFSALRLIPILIYIFEAITFNSNKAERIW